ncbi:MAG: SpoIIIAH-like family protein [Lachnospiraceae bacterium]|nr:SpoIIIAH-like family protein [Lachnospiraceae bacterium]
MKNIVKKNQLIITALVIMVGVAGYLNFTEQSVKETFHLQKAEQTVDKKDKGASVAEEELDVEENAEEEQVGEAVLTSAKGTEAFYGIKLEREQNRAENKEQLNAIINNVNATEEQKNKAIDSMMQIADYAEKENAAETLLCAKGFSGAVVSIGEQGVDVVIDQNKLSEQEIIQIEDIVSRKTETDPSGIIISTTKK